MTAPIVCFVGKSGSGKTTLLERLIPELAARGITAACVKHTHHDVALDPVGTDTQRLSAAGARAVALTSERGQVLMGDWAPGDTLAQVAFALGGTCDVVLAEGFKDSAYPKIEVHRDALGPDLLLYPDKLAAVVSDGTGAGAGLRFDAADVTGLANFIEAKYVSRAAGDRSVDLLVNGERVFLNPFLRTVMERVVLAVVSALKGIPAAIGEVRLRIRPTGHDE